MTDKEQSIQEIAEDIAHNIIDELIHKSDSIEVSKHWGEPSILLCDIINIINNVTNTDYKRYYAYKCMVKESECSPKLINPRCELCRHYFSRKEDKQGCLGVENADEKPCKVFDNEMFI